MSARIVTVEFQRHPDGNTNRLTQQLKRLGLDGPTIKDVSRGRPTVVSLRWDEVVARKLSDLGHYRRISA